jgi:hypothetical protein
MQTATLTISILALVFGLLGFLTGCWAVVNVLGFQRSTHRITQLPAEQMAETVVTTDIPEHILAQLPSPPEKLTAAEYLRWEARQQAEADFYNNDE